MSITLVATVRNEGPYLLEWVAYHRLIGFTDLLVCSNDCDDGSSELLGTLADAGLLTHLRCHPAPDDKAQLHAYGRAQEHLRGAWPEVLMVLDADEFLTVHVGAGTVPDLLGAMGEATAMLVNWRIFGSAGHVRWSPEPVTRRYRRAAPREHGVNRSFKTLFRLPEAYHCPLLPHGPGFARVERLGEIAVVDGAGRPMPEHYARSETFLQSEPDRITHALAQVNHYNTRSWEDYAVKHHRGGGLGPERWDRDENWRIFNRNEEEDRAIERHLPALDEAVADLLGDPAIRSRYERCLDRYEAHVRALGRCAA
jgi:hypothetical protein